jgi:sialic acid synthase SpsE
MATLAEIDETVRTARAAGCHDLMLLKCTSTYPASPVNTHLNTLPVLRQAFGCEVGLSDHTMGCGAAIAAVALGATLVEKHFTLARADGGVDAAFSLEPDELRLLRVETERAWQAMGGVVFGGSAAERASQVFRRSLYLVRPVAAGETLGPDNLRAIRPGHGLPPKYLDVLMGKRVNQALPAGTPLAWDHVA